MVKYSRSLSSLGRTLFVFLSFLGAVMAKKIHLFTKVSLAIKSHKKYTPAPLRILVLVFATLFGLYVCSICLKLNKVHTTTKFPKVEITQIKAQINQTHCDNIQSSPKFPRAQVLNQKAEVNQIHSEVNQTHSEVNQTHSEVNQIHSEVNQTDCRNIDVDRSQIPYLHYPKPTSFNREECACNPVRLFAILSMQRSGSRWFETLLNSHTNVSSNGELFYFEDMRSNVSSVLSTLDRVYNLDLFNTAPRNQCLGAVGFKWMLNQGLMDYHKEIAAYFNNRGVFVIFLFRKNLLRQMISLLANMYDTNAKLLNGTHNAHVQTQEEAEILSRYKPKINPKSVLRDLQFMEKSISEALEYYRSTRHIVLYYGDLVKNHTKLVEVQEFLGLPKMELTSTHVKIHKGSLSEHIENWKQVKRILRRSVYKKFLHSDYAN
ncbi:hypothetical protein CDL12_25795 [Handroanthus impetiginosus]|uniref:Sulfotransferase n=1 Tax=Handroanthus impetiginosus TaxID=429701 RepID=A0A2G9G8T5_9LAMI|nr:hypothetical protein CDL12_25795 [Handroanthus impetiginosus]